MDSIKKNVNLNGDRFYIKIKILNESSIIGFGILGNNSNNIFKTISPGLWCTTDNANPHISIGYHDNMFWSKSNFDNLNNEFEIGCGYINHKLFFTTQNNKSYCIDFDNGHLVLCISESTKYEAYIYNFEYINDKILKLPNTNMNINNNIKVSISPINKNIKYITKNNWYFENKIVISNDNNIYYFNNNLIEKILDKEKRKRYLLIHF